MSKELKEIKKLYGEEMMHLCRELFPTILENEGSLIKILKAKFFPCKFLASDIKCYQKDTDFKDYIYEEFFKTHDVETNKEKDIKSPKELMEKAGYDLYECKTEADIQSFRHYYYRKGKTPEYKGGVPESYKDEELCTFAGGRLDRCHVFFAVKKNANDIKRKDFENPRREDDYGVSVISIQFAIGNTNTVSIKNRYNHTVLNPDATFGNNLDNIIEGLTESFTKYYGFNINQNKSYFLLPGYVLTNDGRYYKENLEINNISYCTDNIIIDHGEVITKYNEQKERYIVADYFIIDLHNKEVVLYDKFIKDAFLDDLKDIKSIKLVKCENGEKNIEFICEPDKKIFITIDKESRIVTYRNDELESINDYFLSFNQKLRSIEIPKVNRIGNGFLTGNQDLKHLNIPNVEIIEDDFLRNNYYLETISLPKLKFVRNNFLVNNVTLLCISFPKLLYVEDSFIQRNRILKKAHLPAVHQVGDDFLKNNENLKSISLPSVISIGDNFMKNSKTLEKVSIHSVKSIGQGFMFFNNALTSIRLPNVETIDMLFLYENTVLQSIYVSSEIEDKIALKHHQAGVVKYINKSKKSLWQRKRD